MAGKNGGARPGAGRKATGAKTKCYTITLPIEEAEELEKRAAQLNKSINRYLRDIIEASGQYGNVSIAGKKVDDSDNSEKKGRKNTNYVEKHSVKELMESNNDEIDGNQYQLDNSFQMAAEGEISPYKVDSKAKGGKK